MYLYSYLYLAEGGPTLTLAVEWGCYTLAGNSLPLQQEKTSSIGAAGEVKGYWFSQNETFLCDQIHPKEL